jgi:hypothetical protein
MPAFKFKDYGTFTGPQSLSGDYNYDQISLEVEPAVGGKPPKWSEDLASDSAFKLTDLAMVLFHTDGDYVGFYSPGTSTQIINLAHSAGEIPLFNIKSKNTIVSGQVIVNDKIIGNQMITCNGPIMANATMTLSGVGDVASNINLAKTLPAKPFDIPHPSKEGQRLRHVSLEGPEIGVYYRGKLDGEHIIYLPDYWKDLVREETITVQLTAWKYSDPTLYIKDITAEKITIGSERLTKINCHYTVYAERKDMDKLIVEYEGTSPKDYPGQDWLNLRGT